jgi:hypothetical protein
MRMLWELLMFRERFVFEEWKKAEREVLIYTYPSNPLRT